MVQLKNSLNTYIMKKFLITLLVIACIIVAAYIGWFILKIAIGLVMFLIFAAGVVFGWYLKKVFTKKPSYKHYAATGEDGF